MTLVWDDVRYGEPELRYLCKGYQLFFRHVDEPTLHGRPPAARTRCHCAARPVRPHDADLGPGAPCTCGGGTSWEACHGG